MDDNILLAKEDTGILTLTLNRPDIMNSLNFSLLRA
jgi:enoyl-CoA hydratase/carnithine racemase